METALIKLVQEQDILWNNRLDGYKNSELKAIIWTTIAEDLNMESG